jgi:hypothetical protein
MSRAGEHPLVPLEALSISKLWYWFLVVATTATNHPQGPFETGDGAEVLTAMSAG